MHPDEERLQRLLDGELAAEAEQSVRDHLDRCADCRAWLAAAEREQADLDRLLELLDHPAPPVTAGAIAGRAASGVRSARFRWAAALLLSAGLAGAAYAVPGSPVRAWVAALGERLGQRPAPAVRTDAPPQERAAPQAGVAVAPGDRLVLSFDAPQAAGEVRVALSEAAEVTVRAPAGAVTFTSDPELLSIHNRGADASYALDIPRGAPRVEIRVAGRTIFLKQGDRITAGPPAAADGSYRLPLTP